MMTRFSLRYSLVCLASASVVCITQSREGRSWENVPVIAATGLLVLHFLYAYLISTQLTDQRLKWGWVFAACASPALLMVSFQAPASMGACLFLLGSIYHAMAIRSSANWLQLGALILSSLLAITLDSSVGFPILVSLALTCYAVYYTKCSRQTYWLLIGTFVACLGYSLWRFSDTFYSTRFTGFHMPSWKVFNTELSNLISDGHTRLLRFYFYFLSIWGAGLFFFCLKNQYARQYLQSQHLLPAFILCGFFIGQWLLSPLFSSSSPSVASIVLFYYLYVLSFLFLAQEVSSFMGRQRTVHLGSVFYLIPLVSVYLIRYLI